MSGQMMNFNKYYQYISNMPEPVMPSSLPKIQINFKEMIAYAKSKGKTVSELTDAEKKQFTSE